MWFYVISSHIDMSIIIIRNDNGDDDDDYNDHDDDHDHDNDERDDDLFLICQYNSQNAHSYHCTLSALVSRVYIGLYKENSTGCCGINIWASDAK